MLIFRGRSWPEHRPWFWATLGLGLAATAWYVAGSVRAGERLGGGSLPGLTFGVLGGLIIVFEMLLWPRKKLRAVRVGRAKTWLKAHLWLGALSAPLILLHTGFRWWNGSLSSALTFAFLGVIVSGVWGLALQQVLPRLMLDHVPAETIHSQIDRLRRQNLDEAERVVRVACGREEAEPEPTRADAPGQGRSFVVIGAVRASGAVQGKLLQTRVPARRVPGAEPLLPFFEETVTPYLRDKKVGGSPLASSKRAAAVFEAVRARLDPAARPVVDMLEDLCDQRRQFDLQSRLHAWLHAWLCVHLPLSAAMFLLMIVHVYFAFKYY